MRPSIFNLGITEEGNEGIKARIVIKGLMGKRENGFCCKEQNNEDLEIQKYSVAVNGKCSHGFINFLQVLLVFVRDGVMVGLQGLQIKRSFKVWQLAKGSNFGYVGCFGQLNFGLFIQIYVI